MSVGLVVFVVFWYVGLLTFLAAIFGGFRLIGRNKTASKIFVEILRSLI